MSNHFYNLYIVTIKEEGLKGTSHLKHIPLFPHPKKNIPFFGKWDRSPLSHNDVKNASPLDI